jgi:hypothetical protein
VDAWRRARIAGQLLSGGDPRDVPHLEGNHHRQRQPHSRQGQPRLNHRRRLEHGLDPLLEPADLPGQALDLREELPGRVRGVRRQKIQALPQEGTPLHAEEIGHLQVVPGVLGQRRVNPILERRALPAQHHPGARQVARVPQLTGRNPHGRQRARLLQSVEPPDVEFVRLVDLPIMSFAFRACPSLGTPPAASISSPIQYQLPIVSTATGAPRSHRSRNCGSAPRSCGSRCSRTSRPSGRTTDASVSRLCASNAIYSIGCAFSRGSRRRVSPTLTVTSP